MDSCGGSLPAALCAHSSTRLDKPPQVGYSTIVSCVLIGGFCECQVET